MNAQLRAAVLALASGNTDRAIQAQNAADETADNLDRLAGMIAEFADAYRAMQAGFAPLAVDYRTGKIREMRAAVTEMRAIVSRI